MIIKAIALDFDGVLTDGTFRWSKDSSLGESKQMCFRDANGITNAIRAGLHVAIISAEQCQIAFRFCMKLGCLPYLGVRDKLAVLKQFAATVGVRLDEIAYMGDDSNDVEVMRTVGFPCCPADAHASVKWAGDSRGIKQVAVSKYRGGHGAVREMIDMIL